MAVCMRPAAPCYIASDDPPSRRPLVLLGWYLMIPPRDAKGVLQPNSGLSGTHDRQDDRVSEATVRRNLRRQRRSIERVLVTGLAPPLSS